jgi:hypothetical protein
MKGSILVVIAAAGLALSATADELYRQDPISSFSGLSSQDARNPGGLGWFSEVVDNFQGQADWTITGVDFWGGYPQVEPGNTQGFMIRFYENIGGAVGPLLLTQDVMSFTRTQFYVHPTLGWPGYKYSLELVQPFDVPADGGYWMSVVAILDRGAGSLEPQWGWVQAAVVNPPFAQQWFFSPGNFTPQGQDVSFVLHGTVGGGGCYANCDGSTTEPILNVADFTCFLSKFAAGDPYANCDGSTTEPILNVADFTCFLSKFAAGC